MAGTSKEYELLFLMKAQQDSSMRQFSVLGGQIKALEDRIQRYDATLKAMEGYRRQTDAITALEAKMKQLEQGTEDVNRRFDEATAAHKAAQAEVQRHREAIDALNIAKHTEKERSDEIKAAIEREKIALREATAAEREAKKAEDEARAAKDGHQKSIDQLKAKLGEERQKLQEVGESLKRAKVDVADLTQEERRLREEEEALKREQAHWATWQNRINSVADTFSVLRMGAQAAMVPVRGVLNFYKESLEAAGKLEYSMGAVKAISGATEEEVKRMTAVVKEMGATTIYTATEAAGAMEKMALAGWETGQMIAGLPAVVKLAAAAGEDLAEMSSIVTDGMNAFHLQGERAAVKFADVLAKTATSSNTTVALLGQSLSYVETTAGNLGYTIEDVSLALAAMANNALKGGVSGTALNTMLTRMSGANETAAKQMDAMGLSMYDASGQAKELLVFLDELRQGFKDFGDNAQEAQIAAYNLAGMRGMRGLLALVGQTDEQWQKLTEDVYAYAGAAEQISDTRLDTYEGQLQLLKDAYDALETSVGETFLPEMKNGVMILRDITDGVNEFVKANPAAVEGFGSMALAAGGAFTGIIALSGAIQGLRYAMNILGKGALVSTLGGFTGVGLASLAVGGAVMLAANAAETERPFREAAAEREKFRRELAEQVEAAGENEAEDSLLNDLNAQRQAAEEKLKELGKTRADLGAEGAAILESGSFLQGINPFSQYNKDFHENFSAIVENDLATETEQKKIEELNTAIAEEERRLRSLHEAQRENLGVKGLSDEQWAAMSDQAMKLANAYQEVYAEHKKMYDEVFGTFDEVGDIDRTTTGQMLANVKEQNKYWEDYYKNLDRVKNYAKENGIDLSAVWETLSSGDSTAYAYTEAIAKNLKKLPEIVAELEENEELKNRLAEYQAEINQGVLDEMDSFKEAVEEIVAETDNQVGAYRAMEATLQGYIDALEDEGVTGALDGFAEKMRRKLLNTVDGGWEASGTEAETRGSMESMAWLHRAVPYATAPGLDGYADGTDNARQGWHMVGEDGPELAYFHGGERVLPAGETRRALSLNATGGETPVVVNINIPAGASPETIREARRYGEDIEKVVRKVLRDERVDSRRRAFV